MLPGKFLLKIYIRPDYRRLQQLTPGREIKKQSFTHLAHPSSAFRNIFWWQRNPPLTLGNFVVNNFMDYLPCI